MRLAQLRVVHWAASFATDSWPGLETRLAGMSVMDRRACLWACASALAAIARPHPSVAQENWPPQHPWPEQTVKPFAEKGKKLIVGTGGAFFFTQRTMLDKYRADPGLGKSMTEAKECVLLDEGHTLTPLETMYMLAGQVHDDGLGDGYAVFLAAPIKSQ
jgi:hypothetical protein